ncbi:hypothetical protein E4U47_005992 [Claviceps purpurea]|nr:hypothetical protein E4U47_005992 [Claviceps purpurea]
MNPEIWIAIPVSPQALVLSCEKVRILMSDAGTDWVLPVCHALKTHRRWWTTPGSGPFTPSTGLVWICTTDQLLQLSLPYKLRHCNNTQVPPLAGHPFVCRLHVEDDKTSER